MPNEFMVVGEHKEPSNEILVKGVDGFYYEYDPARETLHRIEPDETWRLFPDAIEMTDEFAH